MFRRAALLHILIISLIAGACAQDINTTMYTFTLAPSPRSLSIGFGFSGFEGFANCFQLNNASTTSSNLFAPFERIYSSQSQCGGIQASALCNTTTVTSDVNGTNTTNTTIEPYPDGVVEMVLVDPLAFDAGVAVADLVVNTTWLRHFVGSYVSWTAPSASSASAGWSAVQAAYLARTFSGPLRWTNLIVNNTRFISTSPNVQYSSLLRPRANTAIPACLVGFLPVPEAFPAQDSTYTRLEDTFSARGTVYFATTPVNVSVVGGAIISELQVQMNPRLSVQVNYSVAINTSSVANLTTYVNGSKIEIVGTPSYNHRRQFRTDDDWALLPATDHNSVRVIPPPVVIDGTSWDASITTTPLFGLAPGAVSVYGLSGDTWYSQNASLRVTNASTALKNSAPSASLFGTSRALRCLGVTWRQVYSNATTMLPYMFIPTPLEDGSGFRPTSSGSFGGDNPCFPVMSVVNSSASTPFYTEGIRLCPALGTELLPGFHICTSVPAAGVPDFEFGTAIAKTSSAASTIALETNTTAVLDAYLAASNSVGAVTSNESLFVMSSQYKWENIAGAQQRRQATALSCFDNGELLMVPLLRNATPNITLRPSTSPNAASLSATRLALGAWYRCANVIALSTVRITATPLDGYCGYTWRVGLTGELLVSGLLLSYHNTPFVTLSTLYSAAPITVALSSTPRCCQYSNLPGSATQTVCTTSSTVEVCISNSSGTSCSSTASVSSDGNGGATATDYSVTKVANQTLVGRALRCSYDVYNIKRNCTPAVGAYMQLVLLPSDDSGTSLVDNHTRLHEYVDATPASTSLTGLPLQLTNVNGLASFPAAAPQQCFNDTIHIAVVFPTKGATDGTSVITDGAVTSYYVGISSFEYTTDLFAVVRPTPFVCSAGIRTSFVGGTLGVPLAPLDADIHDTCGTLLSGLVSMRAVSAGLATSSPAAVAIDNAPLSSTLAGVLQRATNVESDNISDWRATFVMVVPMSNVTTSNTNANIRVGLRMRSRALAAATDTILTTDVNTVPFLTNLFLSSCVNPSFSNMRVPNASADAIASLLTSDCGSTSIPLVLAAPLPSSPVTVLVELSTFPEMVSTDALATEGVWINMTFSISNFNSTSIPTAASFSGNINFASNLDGRRAPRAFMYSIAQNSLIFYRVEIREQTVTDSTGQSVTTAAVVLPIFVQYQSLYNNLLREVITISWSPNLFLTTPTSSSPSFVYSANSLAFTIQPNERSLLGDAVTWINFLTMSGFVVRTGTIVSLYAATAVCFDDAGDRLSLVLHPLSFGIGDDETTQYLVGAVVGNTCLIVVAFLAQLIIERLLFHDASGGDHSAFKGNIDMEDPDSTKGLQTFPRWGLTMTSLVYPGVLYCSVRAVSLGLNTFLLYTIMLLLVLVGVGYPVILIIAMRYYSPRWQENEALSQKDVTTVTAVAPAAAATANSPAKRSLYKNRLLSARNAVADTQQKVQGFFSKIFTPTGFYEVNHSDHVRFLASYQDYRGNGPLGNSIDAILNLTFAIASAFDCPTNQLVTLIGVVLHLLFLFAYRPYITVGRVLCNVLVDIGCLIGVAITYRGREQEGVLTLQCMMLFTSLLNIFGIVWAMVRSEGLRRTVRKWRKLSKKDDRFQGRGEHFMSSKTKFLTGVEEYLFHLHSVKPQVVYRRNLRKRKLLLHTGNSLDALVIETASDSGSEDDRSSARSSSQKSRVTAAQAAGTGGPVPPALHHRELSNSSFGIPETPLVKPESIMKNDVMVPSLNSTGVSFAMERSRATSTTVNGEQPRSPLKRVTSVAIPSGVSDEDSSDEEAKRKRNAIHLDAPEAMNDKSAQRRRFAQNRFKPYLKTVDGRAFGRSDEQSVVKRLVIGPDGLREVREWREGTQQMANEEIRKRKSLETDFMNMNPSSMHASAKPTGAGDPGNAKTLEDLEANQQNESLMKRWEDVFRYEITKKTGGTTEGADAGEFRESMFHRRQRAMGNAAPSTFDFERGVEMEDIQPKSHKKP
ncbi:membrane-associated protein, putative [Bodo saltans]|uniref:Membrane-associated protein, putative n=1 Tax=Bodo saltans TaxID=75058 RepID=A0A0S4J600_BODSA|nr:membrane-associated protein, putative [Bodo saltans]|eukprot:CUG86850.1 membrane-associated protein, putative [Bodo saltans]